MPHPRTTALEIPMEQMKADIRNVDTFSGYEEMLLSDEAFVGGVSHGGRDGLFAMKLHDHDKYNGSLRALKSFFLFDNRIVCLGSDIGNRADGGVHTTLFQNWLADPAGAIEGQRRTDHGLPLRDNPLRGGRLCATICATSISFRRGGSASGNANQHSLHEETDAPRPRTTSPRRGSTTDAVQSTAVDTNT